MKIMALCLLSGHAIDRHNSPTCATTKKISNDVTFLCRNASNLTRGLSKPTYLSIIKHITESWKL